MCGDETTTKKAVIADLVDASMNDLFQYVHQAMDAKTGDISPEQDAKLDEIKISLCKLLYEQAEDNM